MPILLIDSCYEMIDTNSVSYTQEQAELNCYDQIKKQIEKDHIKIYSEEEKNIATDAESVTITTVILTEKDIAEKEKILFDSTN